MVTDSSHICGEDSTAYREFESQCCTSETNVPLCINYTQKFLMNKQFEIKQLEKMCFANSIRK